MSRIIATASILATDRQAISEQLNRLLSDSGQLIIARQGINVQRNCSAHCLGLITLALEGDGPRIAEFEAKLKALPHLVVKLCVLKEQE